MDEQLTQLLDELLDAQADLRQEEHCHSPSGFYINAARENLLSCRAKVENLFQRIIDDNGKLRRQVEHLQDILADVGC